MPRYLVTERRAYKSAMLIDAEDEEAAEKGDGDIIDTSDTDSWADELLSVEEVDADQDYAEID